MAVFLFAVVGEQGIRSGRVASNVMMPNGDTCAGKGCSPFGLALPESSGLTRLAAQATRTTGQAEFYVLTLAIIRAVKAA